MEKAMARNPNLLRTLLGLSATLILVLSYAVYSATLDSEYYLYQTSNEAREVDPLFEGDNTSDTLTWSATTTGAFSWANFSITNAPEGSLLEVTSGGQKWWSDPTLGSGEGSQFNCMEPNQDFELINHCEYAFTHSAEANSDGDVVLIGIIADALPIEGTGSLRADTQAAAEADANDLVNRANSTITWMITLSNEENISVETVQLDMTLVQHELESVEPFELDPVSETIWSLTALLGCFVMVLILPLGFYYASILRERRQESIRNDSSEGE
ncbi:MAG: hypothetical protein CXX83_00340 [Methanobacteriota archaeon]|nr:MAG: hypothetical protein CXX83_00340 [Euryarchaeota archaeon]